ncbi:primosomal protein [Demequina zhanjiangensis]|uniref:Primosomal protein n=1 Tax=Demequina zhanjiangensis TaxID=3051659 RepID=A0ABT8G1Z2_9MICO|nr:primosomal protein [Demequina sp. SYSU T00b26]MDN4473118.1 primosomal protein [Demequina sp. SYSU T00b26]
MNESREALRRLQAALEEHLAAVAARRGDDDVAVDDAYDAVAEAFEAYDSALDDEFGESLPLMLDDSDELDAHAVEDEDELDDDIEEFELR